MTPKEIERLAIRSVMGEEVCAQLTRHSSGELVMLRDPSGVSAGRGSGWALSFAMAVSGVAAVAQEPKPEAKVSAVLTGRLVDKDGSPLEAPILPWIVLRDESGNRYMGKIAKNGTFTIQAPSGTYDLVTVFNPKYGAIFKAATLHEGEQSVGDVRPSGRGDGGESFTTGGAMATWIRPSFWLRHPLLYTRYLGRRLKAGLRS